MAKKIRHRICKYSQCKQSFRPARYNQSCCSIDHAIKHVKELAEKKKQKDWQKRKTEQKKALMKRSEAANLLQTEINKAIRIIDQNFPCISCQKESNKYDAGHFHSTGAHPELRFNALNIWKQCAYNCNKSLSGNILEYENEITRIYGEAFRGYLRHEIILQAKDVRPSKDDLLELRKTVKEWIKELKPAISNQERMQKRIELNQKLGIYETVQSS